MPSDSPITVDTDPKLAHSDSTLGRLTKVHWLGIAGAAVALASSVGSCQLKQAELKGKLLELQAKQLELDSLKQKQASDNEERVERARKEYLNTLNGSDVVTQARILRFIVATESDDKLRSWAEEELKQVQASLIVNTEANQQRVADLTKSIETGSNSEEAKLEIAVRSSELARLTAVTEGAPAGPSQPSPPPPGSAESPKLTPKPLVPAAVGGLATKNSATRSMMATAECVGICAVPARRCEAACAGDRNCLAGKCFPEEATCRKQCRSGEAAK